MKEELGIRDLAVMYVGNLEVYQGIDLLLESFAMVLRETSRADLIIIGGEPSDIQRYRNKAYDLGTDGKVHFLGPRATVHLAEYLSEADILVSPRIKGTNTPMKIYSYLHSGKAVLATNLPTHTQVLYPGVALLVEPYPTPFAEGMIGLIEDDGSRAALGAAGKRLVEDRFTYSALQEKLNLLFDWLQSDMALRKDVLDIEHPHELPLDKRIKGISRKEMP